MSEPEKISAADITPTEMPTPTAPAGSVESGIDRAPAVSPAPPSPAGDAEKDDAGVPYDPTRHIPHKNKHTGRWMPRGGRKPSTQAKPSPAPQPASFIPANEPQPPKEETPADAAKPKSAAADSPKTEPAGQDHSADAGEVATLVAQTVAGFIFDAPEECTPSPAEHKHMVTTAAAYIRSKGWQSTAGVGLILMFAVWLLKVLRKPKPRETVRGWFTGGGITRAKDVTPAGEKPAASSPSPASSNRSEIIELPANIPPLAKS